jgi:hypothetical protein
MTLPASGAISLNQVNVELGVTATTVRTMNDALVRSLFGVASGAISMSSGYGKTYSTVTGKGYFGGGDLWANSRFGVPDMGPSTSEIDGITFSSETAINPAATLALARTAPAGVSSSSKGYFGGGNATTEIDGINFSTETAINPATVLISGRSWLAGLSSATKGYFGGGTSTGLASSEIDGITFATDTAINPAAVLAAARHSLTGVNSVATSKGYFAGGYGPSTWSAEIDGINFSTEVAINPTATLVSARPSPAGVTSISTAKGYFCGGGSAWYLYTELSEIDGINFSTEAAINPAATLTTPRGGAAGASSSVKGYIAGGSILGSGSNTLSSYTSWVIVVSEIDGINFSTEAAINPAAILSLSRDGIAGVQSA